MVHFSISMILLPHPSPSPVMERQELGDFTPAQKYDQLDSLQTVYDLLYAILLPPDHHFIPPATSLLVPPSGGILGKHWKNYVRTWAAQPARKTQSLAGHQKMPAVSLSGMDVGHSERPLQ